MPSLAVAAAPDFSVVMVTRNNRRYLEPCLASLFDGSVHHRFDVVVVDNGSEDGTPELLRTIYGNVRIIENGRNVGLSTASNQGIRATSGRHVLLLNDDTLVNGASLDAMVDFLDEVSDAAAVGGRLLNEDGSEQSCYNKFSTLREELLIATRLGEWLWSGYPSLIHETATQPVDWIGSACLMLRRDALDDAGVLDEEYFIYGDEADLQYRLRAQGWRVYFIPTAHTVHFGGRSMDRWRRRRMVYRGKLLFYRKNYGALRSALLRFMFAGLSVAKIAWWIAAWPWPARRTRVHQELHSNIDVVRLCCKLR